MSLLDDRGTNVTKLKVFSLFADFATNLKKEDK